MSEHPVMELLEQRKSGQEDASKLALVVEGGMMRGVITGAMVAQLETMGYGPDLFDLVVGTSAGAVNASYYIAKQAVQGVRVYPDYLGSKGFVDRLGWIKKRPIVNLSILMDDIMEHEVPLKWDSVVTAHKLYMTTSDPFTAGTRVLEPSRTAQELKEGLRASCHVPLLAGKPIEIDGVPLYDGGLTAPLPIKEALDLGATHVLALSGRHLANWRSKQTVVERFVSRFYDLKYPGIDKAIRSGVETANSRRLLLQNHRSGSDEEPYIFLVDPSHNSDISQLEKDTSKIEAALLLGQQAVETLLS
jgi:predicted patatin/cPLA2 family phospholipase